MVEPRLSRGLRDLLPEYMLARQRMIDTIRGVYELYGFSPLDTPAVEFLDVLSGSAGEEAQQQIFRVTNPEEEQLGLRFDLTVPLSRVVSQYQDLPLPFRRYQVSPVWRADKPEPGRYREFTQFDLDSVGAESEVADTEILAGMCDTLDALELSRKIIDFVHGLRLVAVAHHFDRIRVCRGAGMKADGLARPVTDRIGVAPDLEVLRVLGGELIKVNVREVIPLPAGDALVSGIQLIGHTCLLPTKTW